MNNPKTTSYTTENISIQVKGINPFPGLRPFTINESHLFFGREGQSDEVLMRLAEHRFVAILGSSGSGKSSLMYCGLLPILYGGFVTKAGASWDIIIFRPGISPIENMAEALISSLHPEYKKKSNEEKMTKQTVISSILRNSSLGLVDAINYLKKDKNTNYFILIDQFEEIFRYRTTDNSAYSQEEANNFISLITEALEIQNESIYIALTMRSDFIGECAFFPNLTQKINESHYLIPQMNREQKKLAIEGPILVVGGSITPRLTQQLLNDIGDNPDQLPVLQHALMRTWQYWNDTKGHTNDPIDISEYIAIGTVKEALSEHANEAYDSLTQEEKKICEVLFKTLTEKNAENKGIRRPTKLKTIAKIANTTPIKVINVINLFRDPSRSLLMPPHNYPIDGETLIDISHESIMRIWTRLKVWLEEESKSVDMYLRLSDAAEKFVTGEGDLWKMPHLQAALNWKEEINPTPFWGRRYHKAYERVMVFLETSQREFEEEQRIKLIKQKNKIRAFRITSIICAAVAIVLVGLVIYSRDQLKISTEATKEALIQRKKAVIESEKAISFAKAAEISKKKAEEETKKAQEARLYAEKQTKIAQEQKEEATRQSKIAQQKEEEAQKSALIAQQKEEEARIQQLQAEQSANEARREREIAEKLRFQSLAQSLAVRVEQIRDPELKSAIAKQAFLYDRKYSYKKYNPDVYMGLFNAWQTTEGIDIIRWKGHSRGSGVYSIVATNEGNSVYSTGGDGKIIKWNIQDPKRSYKVILENKFENKFLAISKDDKYLAVGTKENIILVNLKTEKSTILEEHHGNINDIVFFKNKPQFISIGEDQYIRIYNYENSTIPPIEILKEHEDVKVIDMSSDDKMLISGSADGKIMIWDITEKNTLRYKYTIPIAKNTVNNNAITCVSMSKNKKYIAFGDKSGKIYIWDMETNKLFSDINAHSSRVSNIEFNSDNSLLISTGLDHTTKLWVLQYISDPPIVLKESEEWVFDGIFHEKTKQIITGSNDDFMKVWPIEPDFIADKLCAKSRNLTQNEWKQYVGENILYEKTCPNKQ
ncbi:MAG: hypothetical protein QM536_00440 [Chitinophagaceae bacterium]|nr:hypothetical protein [Chitinophagaceae bacterium]